MYIKFHLFTKMHPISAVFSLLPVIIGSCLATLVNETITPEQYVAGLATDWTIAGVFIIGLIIVTVLYLNCTVPPEVQREEIQEKAEVNSINLDELIEEIPFND